MHSRSGTGPFGHLSMDHYMTKMNVEEWYINHPLGTLHDEGITDAEHRHVELMGKDDLTEAEANELETLTDAFVTHLDQQVGKVLG